MNKVIIFGSPLFSKCRSGKENIAQYLIEHEADININKRKYEYGASIFHYGETP